MPTAAQPDGARAFASIIAMNSISFSSVLIQVCTQG
jgi:hypothetical protein